MSNRTGLNIECKNCKNLFYVEPYLLKSGRKKFCSKKCFFEGRELKMTFRKGHPDLVPKESRGHSPETIQKMIVANRAKAKRGAGVYNWKGGSRSKRHQEMGRYEYKDWRKAVFERDNYACQQCGVKNTYFHADHIKEWSQSEEGRYDIDNGVTLCWKCHYKKTFPNKIFNIENAIRWGVPRKYRKEVAFG